MRRILAVFGNSKAPLAEGGESITLTRARKTLSYFEQQPCNSSQDCPVAIDGDRYFANPYLLASESELSDAARGSYQQFIDALFDAQIAFHNKDKSKDGSIYTGPGGLALTYWRLSNLFKQSNDLERSAKFHTAAVKFLDLALTRLRGRGITFITGDVGVYAVAAVLRPQSASESVSKVLSFLSQALDPALPEQEMLYGRAGYLYALLFLSKYLPSSVTQPFGLEEAILKVSLALLHSGTKYVQSAKSGSPLMYEWHGKRYLGAAHGLMGILYILLDVFPLLQQHDPHTRGLFSGTLDFLLTQRSSTGNWITREGKEDNDTSSELVQWCHGATGAALLFSKAYRCFDNGNSRYAAAAAEAADVLWKFGLLKKGPGLCHGVSGNAYAILSVYHVNRDTKYLHRARHFVSFLISNAKGRESLNTPDHPFSLFEGTGGASCLVADLLLQPDKATFPGFDL